jgi:hypothetical protein
VGEWITDRAGQFPPAISLAHSPLNILPIRAQVVQLLAQALIVAGRLELPGILSGFQLCLFGQSQRLRTCFAAA